MTRILISTCIAAACVLGAAATSSARTTSGGLPCTPKETKSKGMTTVANCGPATATLKLKGKTYSFKNGYCSQSKSASGALQLDLGTLVLKGVHNVKGDAGHAYFAMLLTRFGGKVSGSVFEADFGGKQILGDTLVDAKGFPKQGTLTSQFSVNGSFTGSWNCHGVVVQTP
jgi:hypothetical protein